MLEYLTLDKSGKVNVFMYKQMKAGDRLLI